MNRHFWVWCPDLGQEEHDATAITADGPRSAAEEWAANEDRESADYSIIKGQNVTVCVRETNADTTSQWLVTGEAIPQYMARPITPTRPAEQKEG